MKDGEAIRSEQGVFLDSNFKMQVNANLLQNFIVELNDLVKNNVQKLYQKQYKEVLQVLLRAFNNEENNSLMLLSRSKQIIHSFLNQMEKTIEAETT